MNINYHIRCVFILLMMFSFSKGLCAQQTDTCKIYFEQNSSYIVSELNTNKEEIAKFKSILANPNRIDTVFINVFSSPEGKLSFNQWLTERRADRILSFIIRHSDGKINPDRIIVNKVPECWEGLIKAVEQNYYGKHRERVLEILNNDSLTNHQKKIAIKYIDWGVTWSFFIKEYMTTLRFAEEVIIKRKYTLPTVQELTSKVQSALPSADILPVNVPVACPVVEKSVFEESGQGNFCLGIKTNLLYDALLVPNLGLEFHLGKGFSLEASYCHAWWDKQSEHKYWRIYGGELGLRRYFGGKSDWSPLSGHHVGIYGQCYTYDFELGKRGQLSDMTYGVGVEYGYSLPICRSLNIDFGIGLGYLGGEYSIYDPDKGCYVWQTTMQRHWFGPTKLEISLVWIIGGEVKQQ